MTPTPLQKALDRAPERSTATAVRPETQLFCFTAGGLELAFGAAHVREVVRLSPLTPLPRAPAFLRGVCGHRGEVLPVIDLLRYLGRGELKPGARSRLVVGVWEGAVAGFLAEGVAGLQSVAIEDLQQAPAGGDCGSEYLEAVLRRAGENVLHVLDLPRLLQAIRARVVAR